jgi:alanine dehydrogenase
VQNLRLGVLSRSGKPDERRLPIHPLHIQRIAPALRERISLERGYGDRFGVSDRQLASQVGNLASRDQLLAECEIILLPKPQLADLAALRVGQVLWGWPHCVQNEQITQLAIDSRLTLIAFEAMNHWHSDGSFGLHVFHKNNELAGYCSVLHALQLIGSTGDYGRRLRAAVIGFGATARGAVTALNAHGVHDIDVLTNRETAAVGSPIHSARMMHFDHDNANPRRSKVLTEHGIRPLAGFLAEHDIIVNCVLQDTNAPLTFLIEDDLVLLAANTLIIDVACDEGMGFSWARPTSFAEPTFLVGNDVTYYAVDHSPSYLWNSATWEISEALLPHIATVLAGPDAWQDDPTIQRAIEIQDGVIRNPNVLLFQHRSPNYPYEIQRVPAAG